MGDRYKIKRRCSIEVSCFEASIFCTACFSAPNLHSSLLDTIIFATNHSFLHRYQIFTQATQDARDCFQYLHNQIKIFLSDDLESGTSLYLLDFERLMESDWGQLPSDDRGYHINCVLVSFHRWSLQKLTINFFRP